MGIKNSTTTFAQSWGSTQGKLVRVEVLVLFSAFIWILVELFGSSRRRHSNGFFRFFVWAVHTLFSVLAPYTIGLLQDGPFRDQTFVLWATILLLIQVSTDSISVYSIQDIEQWKRMLVQHVLQIILVLWLILNCKGHNRSYTETIWIMWIQSVILMMEARECLTGCDTMSSICEKLMMMVLPSTSSCNILELGGRLGRELRGVVPEARRWKVLADFWADFILFLAPSSNADIHAEKLATGREFMTHLWALLTHAGILECPSNADSVGGNHGNPAHDSPV